MPGYLGSLLNNSAVSKINVYLYVDDIVQPLIEPCIPKLRERYHNITVHNVRDLHDNYVFQYFDKYIKSGSLNPNTVWRENNYYQRFKIALLKIDAMSIVSFVPRVLLLDIDMLALEDLSHLWEEGDKFPDKYLFGTQEGYSNDSYYINPKYGSKKKHFYPPYGLNSGTLMINVNLMRQDNITAKRLLDINDEYPRMPDQDVYNTWAYYNPTKIGILPCKWNTRDYVPCYDRHVIFNHHHPDRGIFHGNNKKGTSPFIMDPTEEYALEQEMHREYSKIFMNICGITADQMNHATSLAHRAEMNLINSQ